MQRVYPALIHKDPESDYGVSFPDLPGCITVAATLHEVQDLAAEALAFHIEGMKDSGLPIPAPMSEEDAMQAARTLEALALVWIAA